MADSAQKVFAGTRIRRIRRELNITQMQMAEDLGISPSYLNLIERNQRPLSAQLLLRLADSFDIDLKELSGDEDSHAAASLKEVFSDPLFDDQELSNIELTDLVGASPTAAQGMATLYRAYREAMDRNAGFAEQLTVSGEEQRGHRFPLEEVRDYFHDSNNHFAELENAAETLWADGSFTRESLSQSLRNHLQRAHSINTTVVDLDVLANSSWRLDRHRRKLFLSEILTPASRTFQVAFQIGLLGFRELLDEMVQRTGLKDEEAQQLCRLGLANYFAGALVMPYEQFRRAAEDLRYDIELLCQRFSVSFEQAVHRLTTLQRPGTKGVPLFFLRVDHAGNVSKRFSASGFHFARFGGTCPRWNIHEAFRTPDKIISQIVEMEDGTKYFTLARTVSGLGAGHKTPRQQLSIGIGCRLEYARKLVYADGLDISEKVEATPIGVNCRLCLRDNCNQRAHPPLNRRVTVTDYHRGLSPFTFAQL